MLQIVTGFYPYFAGDAIESPTTVEENTTAEENIYEKPRPIEVDGHQKRKSENPSETERQLGIFEEENTTQSDDETSIAKTETESLIGSGADFFGKLIQTLSSKEQTEQLMETLVKKDENGDTYLKIPVKNEQLIQNGLKLLGQFLGNL